MPRVNSTLWHGFAGTQKPPRGWALDWANPLAAGLRAYYGADEGAGDALYDLAGGLTLTAVGAPAWTPAIAFATTTQGASALLPAALQLGWPITLACRIRQTAAVTTSSHIWGLKPNSSNASPFQAAALSWRTSNPNSIALDWNSAGTFNTAPGLYAMAIGADVTLAATFTSTNQYLYADGVLKYTGSAAASNPTYTAATAVLQAGAGNGVVIAPSILFRWGAVWARALSADEHLSLGRAPYQLQVPRPSRLRTRYVAAAAASGGASLVMGY